MADHATRKQEEKKIASPEQMQAYIRVATPGTWLLLIAAALLLAGFCVWALAGRLETRVPAGVVVEDGSLTGYVADGEAGGIEAGETVRVEGKTYTIVSVSDSPQRIDASFSAYLVHIGNFQDGDWVRAIEAKPAGEPLADGEYAAEVVAESISPITFLWN